INDGHALLDEPAARNREPTTEIGPRRRSDALIRAGRLERADGAKDVVRVGSNLEVPADREPAHDSLAIQHDRRRARDVLPLGPAARVHQAIPSRYGEVAVGDEPVPEAQSLGELLAALVGIGRDGDDLDAGLLGLRQLSSKPLELRHAERSPVAAVEDQYD